MLDFLGDFIARNIKITRSCSSLLEIILNFVEMLEAEVSMPPENDDSAAGPPNLDKERETRITTVICKLFHLVELIGREQMTVKALHRMLRLIKLAVDGKVRALLPSLVLTAVKNMSAEAGTSAASSLEDLGSMEPRSRFEFNGQDAVLQVPLGEDIWPTKGYTWAAWVRWIPDLQHPKTTTQSRCLFSLLTKSGRGVEIRLDAGSGQIAVLSMSDKRRHQHQLHQITLRPKEWYFLSVAHAKPSAFSRHSKSACRVTINDELVFDGMLNYPQLSEPVHYCGIGAHLKPATGLPENQNGLGRGRFAGKWPASIFCF
eukprot:GABV01000127.1.p1 GENE.GABV01000127.1~~GABV01000127.1.p1  ORF type:complete len:316 (+),score=106.43 GABV01000127.1:156-1103(+)